MKTKLYTKYHNIDLLKKIDNNGEQFSAEEHAWVMKEEFEDKFSSHDNLLSYAFSSGHCNKLETFPFLCKFIKDNEIKSVLSLGAGDCCLEYLLSFCIGKESHITATDFDYFIIDSVKKYFKTITVNQFDFMKDDFCDFVNRSKNSYDLVVFYGSAYVMDDNCFIKLFRDIKKANIKFIVDFHAGCVPTIILLKKLFHEYLSANKKIKKILSILYNKKYTINSDDSYVGKFHGYCRNPSAIKKLYKKSGWRNFYSLSFPNSHKYVGVLKNI